MSYLLGKSIAAVRMFQQQIRELEKCIKNHDWFDLNT